MLVPGRASVSLFSEECPAANEEIIASESIALVALPMAEANMCVRSKSQQFDTWPK